MKNTKIKKLFLNKNQKIIIEIGSGTGENLFYLSKKYPRRRVIGVEPFKNGAASIANFILKKKINNIYLYTQVFQKFIEDFNNYYFYQCYIFFPDPWPKKKHHKRRLVNYEFLKELIFRCSPKGSIIFGTDNYNYFKNVKKCTNILKKHTKILIKHSKKTPTVLTKYHNRAIKLRNEVNFLRIDKI
ncbi:MAG: hypothetical protein CMI73_03595 [Candidatus Pelagibacter sp.]|nr:hypothetical protein [Candidatus Pelagibacter sp.]OUV86925.1 MAG: hypothetical protein CBC96_03525 [Pelagibacteraceae bacterium TMED136]